jgi:hypothetical protein
MDINAISYSVGTKTVIDEKWVYNPVYFGTLEEAEAYGKQRSLRLPATEYKVFKSNRAANAKWVNGMLVFLAQFGDDIKTLDIEMPEKHSMRTNEAP